VNNKVNVFTCTYGINPDSVTGGASTSFMLV